MRADAAAQRHCRECQYFTGGEPNCFMMMPAAKFHFTGGVPAIFTRDDLDHPITRHFWPQCGTHLATTKPGLPAVVVKIGTIDDPACFIRRTWQPTWSIVSPST